jgi:hypothetical protein
MSTVRSTEKKHHMQRKAAILATAWLAAAATGCAPTWLPKPEGWPDTVAGRTLYVTPAAFIYASSSSAATDVDNIVRGAAADFKARAGETPAKVVVVATDADDPMPFKSVRELLAAMSISRARREGTPEPDARELETLSDAITPELEKTWPLELTWTSQTIVLDSAVAERFLEPPKVVADQAGMVLVMPTKRRIDRAVDAMLDNTLKQLPAAQRPVIALMIATRRALVGGGAAQKQREAPVFEAFVCLQSDWTQEKIGRAHV